MLIKYPDADADLDPDASQALPGGVGSIREVVERSGQAWWRCDHEDCNAEVRIGAVEAPDNCPNCGASVFGEYCANCGRKTVRAEVPEGWVTNHPDDDPLEGAAQFCPDHADRVAVVDPTLPIPEPVVEDSIDS